MIHKQTRNIRKQKSTRRQKYLHSLCDKEYDGTHFCRLKLPQPSYCSNKTPQDFYEMCFCNKFYNGFILKISACTIMLGFLQIGSYSLHVF